MKKDIVIYFTGKIIPALVQLVILIFALRYLGKDEYGKYSLIFYSAMLIHTFTYSWIQQSILRFLSIYSVSTNVVINRFFIQAIISSLIGMILVFFWGWYYFALPLSHTILIMGYVFLFNLFMFQVTLFQAKFKPLQYVVTEGLYYTLFLIFFIIIYYYFIHKKYYILFIAMTASLVIIESVQIVTFFKKSKRILFSKAFCKKTFTKTTMEYGLILTFWLAISYLFNIIDRFQIKEYIGYKEVGIYSAVYEFIYKIATFSCMPVLLAYHPKIIQIWNQNKKKEALHLIKSAIRYEFLIFLVVVSVFLLIKNSIYNDVLNLHEGSLWGMTITLFISAFLWQFVLLMHKPLELLFKQAYMVTGICISLTVNVILNYFLIPLYGYTVAAFTTLAGVITYTVFILIISSGLLKKIHKNE